uniref:Uncharacterized protein n=1 Tax=Aegilops tauschii TaxID=37682 RepID=M8C5X4_AEGTA
MEEAAVAGKLSRLELQRGAADAPSFRMEDLPVEVQPVIMSLLPLEEAVRTSIVSRSWKMLWRFHCDLCFDDPSDPDSDTNDEFAAQDSTKIKQAKFIETVDSVIQQHSGIGVNKFSIRCGLHEEDSNHLDRWISFAISSKAKIIHFDLLIIDGPLYGVHHFPLEALDAQDSSFVQSLFLAAVSIKPHSGICGFTILRNLVLKSVQIFGDFPGLLAKCSALEDLQTIGCSRVTSLSVPHKLDKLQHLLIDSTRDIKTVEFHAVDLAHFEYRGEVISIVLHGCSKLEKATIMFMATKAVTHTFTAVPSILPVKILHMQAVISKYPQMFYMISSGVSSAEVAGMRRHDHLKTVFMSGFRCYKAQIELACCILGNACVLEQLTIEPKVTNTIWAGNYVE